MKTFAYYYKNQMNPEPIGKIRVNSEDEAVMIAVHLKQLSIDTFLQFGLVLLAIGDYIFHKKK